MIFKNFYKFFTQTQKSEFITKGYTVVKNFLTSNQCLRAISRIDQIIKFKIKQQQNLKFFDDDHKQNLIDSADKIALFYQLKAKSKNTDGTFTYPKQKSVNKIGHNLHTIDSVFRQITFSSKISSILKKLNYINPVVPQSMAILKPPKIGGQVNVHQDSTYLTTDPDTLIGFWVPFQKSTKQNGCLWFDPGSGSSPLYRVIKSSKYVQLQKSPDWDTVKFIPVEMQAGDLAIFNGRSVHKSQANTSLKSRYAYSWHLYDAGKSSWQQTNWIPKRQFPNYY